MKKIKFILGIHNHQPVGNFDFVIEEAYQNSYRPFLDVLDDHPGIRLSLHTSGCLIEWLETHHPDYLDRVGVFVDKGQIELLSAGFYEPILAVIPDRDKVAQIKKMNSYLEDRFHFKPRGLWLTERVWEPHLARLIKAADIEYLTVDDFHFLAAGKKRDELNGYYLTDDQGEAVGVFPIQQPLRYAMPFQEPEATIEILRKAADESEERVLVMADDGEKFGVWPGTHERCYGKTRWLDRLFTVLEENQDWITTTTFGDYYDHHASRGRVYLPTVSYFEMSEWTLPSVQGELFADLIHKEKSNGNWENIQPFLRGGTWRNFQSLYDESNWMVKRNIALSNRLNEARQTGLYSAKDLDAVETEIWRSQCNCAYWHGVFGGLYLPHLRHAIFQSLILADRKLSALGINGQTAGTDWDQDGAKEFSLGNDQLQIYSGELGGAIRELDLIQPCFNLSNTMRRYAESYHRQLNYASVNPQEGGSIHDRVVAKEPDLDQLLIVDDRPRAMFQDRFLSEAVTAEALSKSDMEQGVFLHTFFKGTSDGETIRFQAKGKAFGQSIELTKSLRLDGSTLTFETTITHRGDADIHGVYGSEFNLGLLGGHSPDRFYEENGENTGNLMDATLDDDSINTLGVVDEWDGFRITFGFPENTSCWRYPVFSVNMSESGFEKVYQGSAVIPHWPLNLKPGDSTTIAFQLKADTWKTVPQSK